MKTKIFNLNFLLAIFLISILGLVSCEDLFKDDGSYGPYTPPATVTYHPVSANIEGEGGTVDPAELKMVGSNDSLVFNIKTDSNHIIYYVKNNGNKVTITDKYSMRYTVKNPKEDVNVMIKFVPWSKTIEFITTEYWVMKSYKIYQDGKVWDLVLLEEQKTDKLYYYLDETYEYKHSNDEIFGNGNWSLKDETHFSDDTEVLVSKDTLVLKQKGLFYDKPAIYEYVYAH